MDRKDDVVIGCVTNYDFNTIKPWVNSLDSCGFEGHKVVIVYNIAKSVIDELTARNYTVLAFQLDSDGNAIYKPGQPFSIVVERFFHIWALMKDMTYRYMLHTDVKDVIFQRNPSEFLEKVVSAEVPIVGATESILYKDEDWGRENMQKSFGDVMYDVMKDWEIVNAGTLAGDFQFLREFFLAVYMASVGGRTPNPDQAAVNILLARPFRDRFLRLLPQDAWACQAGTTNDPLKIEKYRPCLVDPADEQNKIDDFGSGPVVVNADGEPFYLVHQYDRVPEWKDVLLRKYG